ncbi:MAG: FHA domain-containing protein [Planctomycetes bacterium]|nr:FHA domain-containing protein [Planctomycetota bacterium]
MNQLVYEHEGKRIEVKLANRPVSLGRSPEADHQLPSKAASRIHAQVFLRENAWFVEDLGSSNGTLVNGSKIDGPMALNPGDVIVLADIKLKYEGEPAKSKGPPEHLIARLLYTATPGGAAREYIIRDKVTIGRKPDNTLQIDSKAVSSHHCEVVNLNGAYVVRDLGSSNGTHVGETPVKEHTLRNGDVVIVGKAVKLYFVDPAGPGKQPEPAAAAPVAGAEQPLPASAQVPTRSAASGRKAALAVAGGASDRGQFEPVSGHGAQRPVGGNPLPHILVGAGLGLVFLVAGWLLASLITDARKPQPKASDFAPPIAASGDVALSFEGEIDTRGNPDGWTASFEAPNKARAELLSDPEHPFDGERSLRIATSDLGGAICTLILQSTSARSLDFGANMKASLRMRGEGAGNVALALSAIGEKGEVSTLAVARLTDVKSTQWTEYTFSSAFLDGAARTGRLRLLLSGTFTKLWLDRLELAAAGEARPATPFEALRRGDVRLMLAEQEVAEASIVNSRELAARFAPRLLAVDNRALSEPGLWCVEKVTSAQVAYRTLLPGRGETRGSELRAEARDSEYFPEKGVRLTWKMSERGSSNFAIEATLPLPDNATLLVADRRGAPLVVDRGAMHVYPYATVSELCVNETDLALSFPQGAVVWFDFTRRGTLGLVLRSGPESSRDGFVVDVFTRPVMFARLYERLYKEGERLMEVRNYSAAEARYAWLAQPHRAQRDLPVIGRARDRMKDVAEARAKLRSQVDAAWPVAQQSRTRRALEDCERLIRQYLAEFRGDEVCVELRGQLAQIDEWLRQAAITKRTPKEQQEAEAFAKSLYEDANARLKAGNLLVALLLAENVIRDYSDTLAYRDAQALADEINKRLADPAARDREIDAQLAKIDEEIKFENYALARKLCNELFKRFPDTPRSRDIMLRVRRIDQTYGK